MMEGRAGGWFFIFRLFKSMFFCQLKFIVIFLYLIKYYNIIFIIIVILLGSDRPSGLFFAHFFPYSGLSSYFLRLSLFVIYSSVWENTRAWVPHFAKRDELSGRRVTCQKLTIVIIIIIIYTDNTNSNSLISPTYLVPDVPVTLNNKLCSTCKPLCIIYHSFFASLSLI